MGVSTDAVIFFGYCWEEEQRLIEGDEEWPTLILLKRGEKNPWGDYPKGLDDLPFAESRAAGDKWSKANRAALDAWRAKRDAVEKEFGVEVGQHCSDSCSMPYLEIVSAGFMARRGYPEELDVSKLTEKPEWTAMLDRWLAELGIEKPQDRPRWWLVSWWG
jgi:hypothetical protein